MDATQFRDWLADALARWATRRDELCQLDAAVGDGDLGITVAHGAEAVVTAIRALDPEAAPAQVCRAAGAAFSKASPSTFGALVGSGLLAAARQISASDRFDKQTAERVIDVVTATMMARGETKVGDKTVVDSLSASLRALRSSDAVGRDLVDEMARAARASVDEMATQVALRGRAAWLQARTAGHPDPGAMAYTYLLEALAATAPADL
jgi:dihydroxyacetone kinase